MDFINTTDILEQIREDIQNNGFQKANLHFEEIPVPTMRLRKAIRYGKAFIKRNLRRLLKPLRLLLKWLNEQKTQENAK